MFSYIWVFMAGAMTIGARVAKAVELSISSAKPWAIFAMILAVAGAMSSSAARSARAMCSTAIAECNVNIAVTTGRCVIACRVRGLMNCCAAAVITTSTSKPCLTKRLAKSAAL